MAKSTTLKMEEKKQTKKKKNQLCTLSIKVI